MLNPDQLLGSQLDHRLQIIEKLAAGDFGTVYRARHLATNRDVAVRVLAPSHADLGVVARARREVVALQALRSPHTVKIYELGEAAERAVFIVMELVRGRNLSELGGKKLPWSDALAIARAVCSSLAEAHGLGIVHHDLRASKVWLESEPTPGFVKVLGIGMAKIRGPRPIQRDGCPAPEQILAEPSDRRSDVYALGALIFQMVAGRGVYADALSPADFASTVLSWTAPVLSGLAPVPRELDALVARCLERDPKRRFDSAVDLVYALDAVPAQGPSARASGARMPTGTPRPVIAAQLAAMPQPVAKASQPVVPQSPAQRPSSVLQPPAAYTPGPDEGPSMTYPQMWKQLPSPPPITTRPPTGPSPNVIVDRSASPSPSSASSQVVIVLLAIGVLVLGFLCALLVLR